MDQLELFPTPSPCIGVCQANNKGYCKGCLRSRAERLLWLSLTNLQKQHINYLCQLRRKRLSQLARKQQIAEIVLPEQLDFEF